jgi:hypothetical protein
MGEAVGWAIVGLLAGAVSVVIAEGFVMQRGERAWAAHWGLIVGSACALFLGAFLGVSLAVLQMDSVDGQAITSTGLGILAGGVVGTLGAVAGIVIGAVLKRVVTALSP